MPTATIILPVPGNVWPQARAHERKTRLSQYSTYVYLKILRYCMYVHDVVVFQEVQNKQSVPVCVIDEEGGGHSPSPVSRREHEVPRRQLIRTLISHTKTGRSVHSSVCMHA